MLSENRVWKPTDWKIHVWTLLSIASSLWSNDLDRFTKQVGRKGGQNLTVFFEVQVVNIQQPELSGRALGDESLIPLEGRLFLGGTWHKGRYNQTSIHDLCILLFFCHLVSVLWNCHKTKPTIRLRSLFLLIRSQWTSGSPLFWNERKMTPLMAEFHSTVWFLQERRHIFPPPVNSSSERIQTP